MMEAGIEELGNAVNHTFDAINLEKGTLKKLNVIVAGRTGVGKSTLINAVFKSQLADTGVGMPVTSAMRKLTKEGIPLAVYDTPGFEMSAKQQEAVKSEIFKTIREGLASRDLEQRTHCIWYCINTAGSRIEPMELEWLREFSDKNRETNVPIIVLLTQAWDMEAERDEEHSFGTEFTHRSDYSCTCCG